MESQNSGHSSTVLVADDEEMVLDLTRRILERQGYSVLTATDGAAALELFNERAQDIDLVFLDITMPRMSGQEAVREILKVSPQTRVILSTGFDAEQLRSELDLDGKVAIVQKPFNARELLDLVEETLAH